MALLWIDGFEKYGTVNSAVSPSDIVDWKYNGDASNFCDIVPGRNGKALQIDSISTFICTPALNMTGSRTLIVGFAFNMSVLTAGNIICDMRNPNMYGDSNLQLNFRVSGGGDGSEIAVYRGNTLLDTSTTANLQTDTWYYFEAKVYCSTSSGTCNVYIDETEVISFSGDTRHRDGSDVNDRYDRIMWQLKSIEALMIDDLYIANDAGSGVTDVLGDCIVATLSPTSDVTGNWTPSTGNNLYDVINEDAQDSSYISDDNTGNQAVFELENLSGDATTGVVRGVMLCCDSQQSVQGMTQYAKALTQNGSGNSVVDSGNFPPGVDNPLDHSIIMETDPDGNAWSNTSVNQLRFGVEVAENGS